MLSNFTVAAEAVLPMFCIMAVGILIRKRNLVSEDDVRHLNKMTFMVFFPILMFSNLYGQNIAGVISGKLIAFGIVAILIIFGITTLFVVRTEKNPKTRGAMIQAIYRSNFVIMGIPIVSNIFGSENLALTSVMITVIVPIYNVLAVITLEIFRGGKVSFSHIVVNILKNPLIIGAIAGIVSVVIGLKVPAFLEKTIESMAAVATPMALLMLGASFDISSLARCKKDLLLCVIGKLIIVPAIGLSTGALLGFRGVAMVTLIAIFASPTAVSSYPMAQQMESDDELAGNAVIFSSLFSCVTMFMWIFLLKCMGFF